MSDNHLPFKIDVDINVPLEDLQFLCFWLNENLDKWEISMWIPKNYPGRLYPTNLSSVDWKQNYYKVQGLSSGIFDTPTLVTAYLDNDIDAMAVKLAWL